MTSGCPDHTAEDLPWQATIITTTRPNTKGFKSDEDDVGFLEEATLPATHHGKRQQRGYHNDDDDKDG
jgi:hypothetical protein